MPWLTPEDIPEDGICRPLSIPADSVWLSLISGALTELTKPYNWQQFGALTVQETVDKMQSIIDDYYDSPCAMCVIPGGYRVVRINPAGHLEQLDPDGNWVDATDEYHIPPPEAREGGTEEDRKCLAAKNAVNVLNELYDSLADSWANELSEDEAVIALIAVIVARVGFAFAPIVWAIVIPLIVFFGIVYRALAYLTADLWDSDFTDKLECLFLECASDDAGVVTFDYECIMDKLQALATEGGFSEVQARLNVQISYILQFIGGVDALNLAARTTDITNDDCSHCDDIWDCYIDFTETDGAFIAGTYGVWTSGAGWESTNAGATDEILQFDQAFASTHFLSQHLYLYLDPNNDNNNGGFGEGLDGLSWTGLHFGDHDVGGAYDHMYTAMGVSAGNGGHGHFIIRAARFTGTGVNPFEGFCSDPPP